MKMMRTDEDVYMGYYINNRGDEILLAISTNKEVVENYLKVHRKLNKHQYIIKFKNIPEIDLVIKYEDQIITEFNGYYIPTIDSLIIELYSTNLEDLITECANHLKHITVLASNVKKVSPGEIDTMVQTLKLLGKMQRSNKILRKLNMEESKHSDFLFANIDDYLKAIKNLQEQRDSEKYYLDAMWE